MARSKKNMLSGMINIIMLIAIIPILTSALGSASEDPAVAALVGILPVVMIFNALGDFF